MWTDLLGVSALVDVGVPAHLPPFVPLSLLPAIFSCCCPAAERCVVVALCVRAFAACIYVHALTQVGASFREHSSAVRASSLPAAPPAQPCPTPHATPSPPRAGPTRLRVPTFFLVLATRTATPAQATVGLRVPRSEEVNGMDLTRHSFSTSGSFSAANGGGGSVGGGKNGGWNALHRAMAAANGTADSYGGDASMRSHHSSRAASLSGSKHGDMNGGGPGPGPGPGPVSNGKHEHAWGWGHNSSAGGISAMEQQHRARSITNVFGQPGSSRQGSATSAAEAVTPSVGRAGSGYGFKGAGVLGVPASEKSAMPELGQPRSRRAGNQQQQQQQGWESGVVETKSEDPRYY